MEIIITRKQLINIFQIIDINLIRKHHIAHKYYFLYNECHKMTFRDDDGTEIILKDKYGNIHSKKDIEI